MIKQLALVGLMSVSPLGAQLALPGQSSAPSTAAKRPVTLFDSVFRIAVSTQISDYRTPWSTGGYSGGCRDIRSEVPTERPSSGPGIR